MAMDADELRRIAREAPLRNAQEEAQAEAMKRKQRRDQLYEEEWRLARQAVADLDENIRKAADEGKYETVVYRAWANGILIIEHSPKYSWWDESRRRGRACPTPTWQAGASVPGVALSASERSLRKQ
jgi:hypothetical protein